MRSAPTGEVETNGNTLKRTGHDVSCPCGAIFYAAGWELRVGRGKYCSKDCKYKYRVRPSGLKYNIKVENKSWIQQRQRLSPDTEFKKGDKVIYSSLHSWVRHRKGSAQGCVICLTDKGPFQWANISHEYLEDLDDFASMCIPCHRAYDAPHRGASRKAFT